MARERPSKDPRLALDLVPERPDESDPFVNPPPELARSYRYRPRSGDDNDDLFRAILEIRELIAQGRLSLSVDETNIHNIDDATLVGIALSGVTAALRFRNRIVKPSSILGWLREKDQSPNRYLATEELRTLISKVKAR